MVRHGTQRKRRAGNITKQKQQAHRSLRITKAIQFNDIREQYDKTKSPTENLAEFGLETDCNKIGAGPNITRNLAKGIGINKGVSCFFS
jgi:hypothetical protein